MCATGRPDVRRTGEPAHRPVAGVGGRGLAGAESTPQSPTLGSWEKVVPQWLP
jgi:hypothetical protein